MLGIGVKDSAWVRIGDSWIVVYQVRFARWMKRTSRTDRLERTVLRTLVMAKTVVEAG